MTRDHLEAMMRGTIAEREFQAQTKGKRLSDDQISDIKDGIESRLLDTTFTDAQLIQFASQKAASAGQTIKAADDAQMAQATAMAKSLAMAP